jgi:hypothetical protein
MNARMGRNEKRMWEQAVQVLRRNSVTAVITTKYPSAEQMLA